MKPSQVGKHSGIEMYIEPLNVFPRETNIPVDVFGLCICKVLRELRYKPPKMQ